MLQYTVHWDDLRLWRGLSGRGESSDISRFWHPKSSHFRQTVTKQDKMLERRVLFNLNLLQIVNFSNGQTKSHNAFNKIWEYILQEWIFPLFLNTCNANTCSNNNNHQYHCRKIALPYIIKTSKMKISYFLHQCFKIDITKNHNCIQNNNPFHPCTSQCLWTCSLTIFISF